MTHYNFNIILHVIQDKMSAFYELVCIHINRFFSTCTIIKSQFHIYLASKGTNTLAQTDI